MNKSTLETLMNYLMLFGIILILFSGIISISYYFSRQKASCMLSPFVYGAKQLKESYPDVQIIGQLTFVSPGKTIDPVYFDETGIKKEEKNKKNINISWPY